MPYSRYGIRFHSSRSSHNLAAAGFFSAAAEFSDGRPRLAVVDDLLLTHHHRR